MAYQINYDSDRYKALYISAVQLVRIMKGKAGTQGDYSLINNWEGVEGALYQKKPGALSETPDITFWNKNPVFSPKAYDLLRSMLSEYGELLPVFLEGEAWYVFNILKHGDQYINDTKSNKKDEGEETAHDIAEITFVDDGLPLIFKTEFDSRNRVFCNDKFKGIIEKNALTGLVFSSDLVKYMHA